MRFPQTIPPDDVLAADVDDADVDDADADDVVAPDDDVDADVVGPDDVEVCDIEAPVEAALLPVLVDPGPCAAPPLPPPPVSSKAESMADPVAHAIGKVALTTSASKCIKRSELMNLTPS
jgi:hypothetical protein